MDEIDKDFEMNGNRIIIYLMKIHPIHWRDMGNLSQLEDDKRMPAQKKKLKFYMMKENDLTED